ncbi:MAG: Rpn family recombination-promoting nuclease/putative transposase, partial [Fibrobacter sp.]|nr:Rpn family recombination-promoting nuclease/putative transposase [Fibrobacter sp.]
MYAASAPGKPEHVYLLFEHKSYPDPMAGVQLQKNIAMVFQYHERQHAGKSIPVIFTMVICHGKKSLIPCKGPVCRFVPYQKYQPFFPDLRFIFIDLQAMDDDQIKGNPYLRILFLTLKYIHSPDLLEKIRDILVIFRELDKDVGAYEYLLSLITYLAGTAPKKLLKKLLGRINRILKKEKNPMSNIIEDVFGDLIKERLEKATTEGMRKGMRK